MGEVVSTVSPYIRGKISAVILSPIAGGGGGGRHTKQVPFVQFNIVCPMPWVVV